MSKFKIPFSPADNHSYNVNVAVCLKHTGMATILKEMRRSHVFFATNEKNKHDGFNWFFLRMDKLKELYPEYNPKTMYKWISKLEDHFLIASRTDLNQHGYDKTRWFTVNLEAYNKLTFGDASVLNHSQNENSIKWKNAILKMKHSISQNENSYSQNESSYSQNDPTIQSSNKVLFESPVIKSLDISKSKDLGIGSNDSDLFNQKEIEEKEKISAKKEKELLIQKNAISIIDSLNGLTGRDYSKNVSGRGSKNVQSVIKILKKGYSFDELNDMVIFKCWEWLNNSKMAIYLQPSTLFGGKHETYIEQAKIAKENPAFVEAMKKAKESENKGKPLQGGTITNQAANTLKNW